MKTQLRKRYIALRQSAENKTECSALIAQRLFEQDEYKSARCIAIYKSMPSEASTDEIIKDALSVGKTVALPKTTGSEMRFYKIEQDEPLIKSPFGVWEPVGDEEKYISPEELDLIIVPGVAFDRDKNRLGFGKGCYDRFLPQANAATIALCFSLQIAPRGELATDEFDIKMQKIITERETI